jgi:hypothetical protein
VKRNHWIGIGVLVAALLLALQNPVGAGHLVTEFFQGINNMLASIGKS